MTQPVYMNSDKDNDLTVSILQTDIIWCNPEKNRAHIEELIDASPHSDLFVLPEMFTTGFCMTPQQINHAEQEETVTWMQELCRKYHCAITGSIIANEEERFYNRCFFIHEEDTVTYDKRHLFSYGGEDKVYTPGNKRVIVEFKGVRFLLQICYDLRFPVFSRNKEDYDAIIYVANWPVARINVWNTLLSARAMENQCYIIGANRTGSDPCATYNGSSRCIDPYGRVLASCTDYAESSCSATIQTDTLKAFRDKFPALKDADKFICE